MIYLPPGGKTEEFLDPEMVEMAPACMPIAERLLLWSLVLNFRPTRVLEIGTGFGGSAALMHGALEMVGEPSFVVVTLDPNPNWRIDPSAYRNLRVVIGESPSALRACVAEAGGLFDFVLVDGAHTSVAVMNDLLGLSPLVRSGGLLLVHDANCDAVRVGIAAAVAQSEKLGFAGQVGDWPWKIDGSLWGGFILVVRK